MRFYEKLNEYIKQLDCMAKDISEVSGISAAALSRYRSEERLPDMNSEAFDKICFAIAEIAKQKNHSELTENFVRKSFLDTEDFLHKLDEFDLNDYIKAIHFDELKVPSVPFQIPTSKTYFGLKEMMESELDFLKATVLSKSMEPVTMYSDMPMEEMAKDPDFPKKWMFGMAMMLKKGLHLNQIHNLDRSFEDMMLGLESWIPIYMTCQISPYYLKMCRTMCLCIF